MTAKDAGTHAARVRAAQGWADLSDDKLAAEIGVSKRTLGRLKAGADVSYERRVAIAKATGVPEWFMETGFDGAAAPDDPVLAERIEALEARLHATTDAQRVRDERLDVVDRHLQALLDLSRSRIGADLAEAARQPAPGEDRGGVDDTDRPDRRPGDADR